jgi:hypothetical protein
MENITQDSLQTPNVEDQSGLAHLLLYNEVDPVAIYLLLKVPGTSFFGQKQLKRLRNRLFSEAFFMSKFSR